MSAAGTSGLRQQVACNTPAVKLSVLESRSRPILAALAAADPSLDAAVAPFLVPAALLPAHDFLCPVCQQVIKEPFMTHCGHSYCFLCLTKVLERKSECPTCHRPITRETIFPNFALDSLLRRHLETIQSFSENEQEGPGLTVAAHMQRLQRAISADQSWRIADIDELVKALVEKKNEIEEVDKTVDLEIVHEFLLRARDHKQQQMTKVKSELSTIEADILAMEAKHSVALSRSNSFVEAENTSTVPDLSRLDPEKQPTQPLPSPSLKKSSPEDDRRIVELAALKKRRIQANFDDLLASYFESHRQASPNVPEVTVNDGEVSDTGLESFTDNLCKFTRYSRFHEIASIECGETHVNTNIFSAIEFDRDDEYFAVAGVAKKIKIFEYRSLLHDPPGCHFPLHEISTSSKISCLSWNSYIKSQLLSSDYEGVLTLWDAYTGAKTALYEEHAKRVWSADFSAHDPTRFASGSDDNKVKIWSTSYARSALTVETKANVCCVKFNPNSSNHIAVGSADHIVQYFDLRKPKEPLIVLRGHKKAVAYVRFLNGEELISASTDNTLKLWDVSRREALRTFTGHMNEKNFVGLSTSGDFMCCGSENNSVYVYYKPLAKPLLGFKFDRPVQASMPIDDSHPFVSCVCWKRNSSVVLAANSSGTIKALELRS